MDICSNILESNETKASHFDETMFDLVLKEFLSIARDSITFTDCPSSTEKVLNMKDQYVYTSDYAKLFFGILAKYNYNLREEIVDAMFNLGRLKNPNNNKMLIRRLLGSPFIQDVSFNGKNEFVISSQQYGKLVFQLASYYFKKNNSMANYIKSVQLPRHCHDHTYFMSGVFANYYAITALCKLYFGNTHYHSYAYDKDRNAIIDLCGNIIMDKDLYYHIFRPYNISVVLNSKVERELALVDQKTEQPKDRCELLKIALYKQYLNSIGYQGDLEEAPVIKTM